MPQARPKLSKAETDLNFKEMGDKARSEALALIASAKAEGIFEAEGPATAPIVRHKPSGIRCHFDGGGSEGLSSNVLAVLDVPGQRGDNVGCGRQALGAASVMFINRAPRKMTIDEAFADAEGDLRTLYRDAAPWTAESKQIIAPAKQAPQKGGRYAVTQNGVKAYTRLTVALVEDWIVTYRVTSNAAVPQVADLNAETWLNLAITERFATPADVARRDADNLRSSAASQVARAPNGAKFGTFEYADRNADGKLTREETVAASRAASSRAPNLDVENRWFERRDEDKSCSLDAREYTMRIPSIDLTRPLPEEYRASPSCPTLKS